MSKITLAAKRIAKKHNEKISSGLGGSGFLVCGRSDGAGGAWYADNSRPNIGPDDVKVNIGWSRVTARDIQERLDMDHDAH